MTRLAELDRVTPVYLHRMSRLSPQQRKVIATMAYLGSEDGCFARDVARAARMDTHSTSAILGRLEGSVTWADVFAPDPPGLSMLEVVSQMPRHYWVSRGGRVGRAVLYHLVDQRLGLWLLVRRSPALAYMRADPC